ncbi:MAG: hypothetical protein HFG78_06860 [Hungatella sp.]|nr:hypothetical protein [Hungatella sp.]
MDSRFDKMEDRLNGIDFRFDKIDVRFDWTDSRLEVLTARQNKMTRQLSELRLIQNMFMMSTNKKLRRLLDGIETIEEILKINHLMPA